MYFLLFLLLSLSALSLEAEPVFYLSNSSGQILSETTGLRWESKEWILKLDEKGSRTLLNFGEVYRRTVTENSGTFRIIYLYDGEVPVSKATYTSVTRELKEEILYEDGLAWRKSVFYYRDGKINEKLVYDGQERLLYRSRYYYGKNGRILKVETKDQKDVFQSFLLWNYDAMGIMTDKISMKARQLEWTRFDNLYREESRILEQGGEEQVRISKEYLEDGSSSLTEINVTDRYKSRNDYDSDGNLLLRDIQYENGEQELYSYTYNEGQIVRFVHSKGPLVEEEQWLWQNDQPLRMTYFRNSIKQKVRIYKEGKIEHDEIYRNGSLMVVVEYSDERPVRELYYSRGQLLRQKELILE